MSHIHCREMISVSNHSGGYNGDDKRANSGIVMALSITAITARAMRLQSSESDSRRHGS